MKDINKQKQANPTPASPDPTLANEEPDKGNDTLSSEKDSTENKKKMTGIIFGVVIVVLVTGGGLLYYFSQNQSSESTQTQDIESTENVAEENNPTEPIQQPDEISLVAIAPYTGTATATRLFVNNTFIHTVTMSTKDPPAGKFYEGWLVKKTPTLTFVSTGKLVKENGIYMLKYSSSTDYSDYNQVVITEETEANGLDNKPETHVFEGDF